MARLPQPLALIEVGASAGLTLLVDRYLYGYARMSWPAATRTRRPCAVSHAARSRCRPRSRGRLAGRA